LVFWLLSLPWFLSCLVVCFAAFCLCVWLQALTSAACARRLGGCQSGQCMRPMTGIHVGGSLGPSALPIGAWVSAPQLTGGLCACFRGGRGGCVARLGIVLFQLCLVFPCGFASLLFCPCLPSLGPYTGRFDSVPAYAHIHHHL